MLQLPDVEYLDDPEILPADSPSIAGEDQPDDAHIGSNTSDAEHEEEDEDMVPASEQRVSIPSPLAYLFSDYSKSDRDVPSEVEQSASRSHSPAEEDMEDAASQEASANPPSSRQTPFESVVTTIQLGRALATHRSALSLNEDRMSIVSACSSGVGYDEDNEMMFRVDPPKRFVETKTISELAFKPTTNIDDLVERSFAREAERYYAGKISIRGCLSSVKEQDDRDQHTGWAPGSDSTWTVNHAWIDDAATRVFHRLKGVEQLELIDLEWGDVPSRARRALRSEACFTVLTHLHLVKVDFWNSNQLMCVLSDLCVNLSELRVAGCLWSVHNHTRLQISDTATLKIPRLHVYEDAHHSYRALIQWLLGRRDACEVGEAQIIWQTQDVLPVLQLVFGVATSTLKTLELRFQRIAEYAVGKG